MKEKPTKKTSLSCEALEPRILLSAGMEGLIADSLWDTDNTVTLDVDSDTVQLGALLNNEPQPEVSHELVFIDSNIDDYQSMVDDLLNNDDASRQFEIIILDSELDGVLQVSEALQSHSNIDAVHIVSHGSQGVVQLGDSQLSSDTIEQYSESLSSWQHALNIDADLVFYGCDLAGSVDGQSLLLTLSELTQADVTASDDTTGADELGGDWSLEYQLGDIDTDIAFSQQLQNQWASILPIVSFQEGVSGYSGTFDTELDAIEPSEGNGNEGSIQLIAGSNQGLIRFDNIFGSGAGQIAYGSTINSATLTVNVTGGSTAMASIELHTMLVSWNESATWNSTGNGIQLDDSEASIAVDSTIGSANLTGAQDFSGLAATLQAWSDQTADNYGWVIVSDDSNNFVFSQSETLTLANRPVLTIDYSLPNTDPVITSGANPSVTENATAVTTVTASDADGDTPTFAISGGLDQGLFSINATTGALSFNTAPDYETPADSNADNVYVVQVSANDGNGGIATQTITVTVTNINENPVITSGAIPTVSENATAVTTVTASDVDGDTPTFAITGGLDQGQFSINTTTGALSFNTAPDFESPTDSNGDNIYEVQVTADDGNGGSTVQTINVTVTDANENPVITSGGSPSVLENTTAVASVTASDVDGDIPTFAITGGLDQGLFSINAVSGALSFTSAPNFEAPTDGNGDNVYEVQVTADDGNGGTTTQTINVTVTNANEDPIITSGATPSVTENTTAVTTIMASDVDGDTATFSITGGLDQALFIINPSTGVLSFNVTPDYETPGDSNGDNVYEVQVTADDGNGGTTTQTINVTVTNTNENPVITSGASPSVTENATAVTTVTATDVDGDTPTFAITGGLDQGLFNINATTGALSFTTAPNFEAPADSNGDNVYEVQVAANDGNGGSTAQTITVTVTNTNEGPVITSNAANSVIENASAVTTVTATDVDGDTPTFAITGGLDQGLFSIDAATGALSFNVAPDFETPSDSNIDNTYEVQVTAYDGNGASTVQDLTISVLNANEAPSISSYQFTISGDSAAGSIVGTISANDVDAGQSLSYTLVGGTGSSIFNVDSSSGSITVANPAQFLSGSAQSYTLEIVTTDSSGASSSTTVTIHVLASPIPIVENQASGPVAASYEPPVTQHEFTDYLTGNQDDYQYIASHSQTSSVDNSSQSDDSHSESTEPQQPPVVNKQHEVTKAQSIAKLDDPDYIHPSIRTAIAPQSLDDNADYDKYMLGKALRDALNLMNQEIDESLANEAEQEHIFSAGIQGSSIVLTAGFATWALRGSSLLASFLSTIPVWRGLDPLPILAAAKNRPKQVINIAEQHQHNANDEIDNIFDHEDIDGPAQKDPEDKHD